MAGFAHHSKMGILVVFEIMTTFLLMLMVWNIKYAAVYKWLRMLNIMVNIFLVNYQWFINVGNGYSFPMACE